MSSCYSVSIVSTVPTIQLNHVFILVFKNFLHIFKCILVLSPKWNKTFLKTFYSPNTCHTVSSFGFYGNTVYSFLPHFQGCFSLSCHLCKDKYKSRRKKNQFSLLKMREKTLPPLRAFTLENLSL